MARVLCESSTQLLARLAMRDAIGRTFLVEGVAEEPPLLPPLLGRLGHCSSPWHRNRAKALLSSCLDDDDYVYTPSTSLEASSKSSFAFVLFSSFCVIVVCHRSPPMLRCVYTNVLFIMGRFGSIYKSGQESLPLKLKKKCNSCVTSPLGMHALLLSVTHATTKNRSSFSFKKESTC